MKRIITILFLFISGTVFAQNHIEIVSEVADTMALINKTDMDKINTVFNRLRYADSLNTVNENIIDIMNSENMKLESVISEQKVILTNKDTQIQQIKDTNREALSNLERQLKRANRKKTFWEVTTGVGVIGIIFLAIF